jgi:hypothetical protein
MVGRESALPPWKWKWTNGGFMAVVKDTAAAERDYANPTDATRVRDLIARIGLGQRGAARELEINERTMRGYCAGDKVPRVVMLALERLVDLHRQAAD